MPPPPPMPNANGRWLSDEAVLTRYQELVDQSRTNSLQANLHPASDSAHAAHAHDLDVGKSMICPTKTADAGVTAHPHSVRFDLEKERYVVVKERFEMASTKSRAVIDRPQPSRIVPGCTIQPSSADTITTGGARIGEMRIDNALPFPLAGSHHAATGDAATGNVASMTSCAMGYGDYGMSLLSSVTKSVAKRMRLGFDYLGGGVDGTINGDTGGPSIAEFSIADIAPIPTHQFDVSPVVVTPTDADLYRQMPAALATNNPFVAGYGHKSNFPSDVGINQDDTQSYTYGRVRRYDECDGKFGRWEPLIAYDPDRAGVAGLYTDEPCEVHLKRGGMIRYFPKIVSEERRATLAQKCRDFQEYRQYKFGPGGLANEPRVHVLLSAKAAAPMSGDNASTIEAAPGYRYHGIKMQAQPLSSEPVFEALSTELAAVYEFPNHEWNIGCDAIVYRNGNDNIGWHSDDTQGESKVMCIVPESPGISRPVHIRPKRNAKKILTDGDEEIQLFVRQGDGCK